MNDSPYSLFINHNLINMSDTTGCQKCKQKDRRNYQWLMIILGFYVIFSAVYGSVKIFEKLIEIFR